MAETMPEYVLQDDRLHKARLIVFFILGQWTSAPTMGRRAQDRSPVALTLAQKLPPGAARDVVGIRRGAISGNMKVSFQAARSIG